MNQDLTVVIKPTRNCNLRCKYCSVGEPESRTLTFEEVKLCIEKIVLRSPGCNTKFIWHGGEPLLAGLDFYQHVVDIEKPLRDAGYGINNVIQSNGTLITKEWAEFFRENEFGVGLSIDGPEEINNKTRVFEHDKGSFQAILRGSNILKKYGVNHGYLVVVSRYNVDQIEKIIDFMQQEKRRYKLVAVAPIGRAAEAYDSIMIEGDNFSDSQISLFRRWLKEGHFSDRAALWKYLVSLLTNQPIECIFFRDCQQSFVGVDCNADVFPCGRFCGGEKFKYGNLVSDNFVSIWNNPKRLAISSRYEKLPDSCKSCRYFSICHGGCPLQGCLAGGLHKPDYNCLQYKKIFQTMEDEIFKNQTISK